MIGWPLSVKSFGTTRWTALLLVTSVVGCGDDGSADATGTTSTDSTSADTTTAGDDVMPTSGSTSEGTAGTGSADGTGSTGGTTTADDSTDDTTGQGDTTASDSSSGDASDGVASFDVPFTVLDPSGLPLSARVQPGWTAITTLAEWTAVMDAPVPAGVTFPGDWVVFGSLGPQAYPGHSLQVEALTWSSGSLLVDGGAIQPGLDCETYEFTWPADTLLQIDALDQAVDEVVDQTAVSMSSCAGGGGDSASCDLDMPCATGLLCAGLVRSTVLINDPNGLCLTTDFQDVFTGAALPIPTDGTTVESQLAVAGLATVDMDVIVWVELDHPAPEELVIELRNPDGNQVSVANLTSSPLHPGGVGIVPNGFSGDESVNGNWALVVRDDVVNANNGGVDSWQLEIMSRLD